MFIYHFQKLRNQTFKNRDELNNLINKSDLINILGNSIPNSDRIYILSEYRTLPKLTLYWSVKQYEYIS